MSTPKELTLRMRLQGYQSASHRPRCGNCRHDKEGYTLSSPHSCALGGFMVTVGAVCEKHEPKPVSRFSP